MPGNIDPAAQARRRREAWQSVIVATTLRLAMAALVLGLRWYYGVGGLAGTVLLLFVLLDLGSVLPVWILLKRRLKEIEGGEEDAAAQY